MSLFILNGAGDFRQGFTVDMKVWSGDSAAPSSMLAGERATLPPAADLPELYQAWQVAYGNYLEIAAKNPTDNNIPTVFALKGRAVETNVAGEFQEWENQKQQAYHACQQAERKLLKRFHQWLESPDFRELKARLREFLALAKEQANRILIESNNELFKKMPWQKWDCLREFSLSEVGFSSPKFEKRDVPIQWKKQARILAILGKDANIQEEIQQLATDNVEIRVATNLADLDEPLWNEAWDIIIFNGHSSTSDRGTQGRFQLSEDEWLSIGDIRGHFNRAIERGLKLVIFNSCDGLGLAYQLGEGQGLYLPQIIVMREVLPVPLAPIFLKYFFEEFIGGISLYSALRKTRDRLEIEEKRFPSATWLPAVCQNPAVKPLSWNDLVIPPCPYRGLSAFQEEDVDLFFGREAFIDRLVEVVADKKLVAVIGASGSGKSSVVLAGLIPRLRQQENWLIASLRPGVSAFENLAKALGLPEELARDLQEGVCSFPDVLKSIAGSRTVLLVVDQFEEIYSYPNRQFLDCLLDGVADVSAFRLVITLRADFVGQAIEYNRFREQLQRWKPEFIGAMERGQLQAVIEQPAQKRGVSLAAGLMEKILNDVGKEPGYLPLLEFALTEIWNKQEQGWLTRKGYDEIGGVENALRRHAERVFDGLEKRDKEGAKRIFLLLVSPGEGTEYTRRLATRAEVGEENWDLVIRLATARLVVSNQEKVTETDTVEIVHEALIEAWPDLHGWIEEDDAFLRWKKRLQVALREWDGKGKKKGYLLQDAPLAEAEGYLQQRFGDISPGEREFIQLGVKLRNSKLRRTILGLSSALAAVSIFATGALWQWQRAERQSLINEVDSLSYLALNQFESGEGGISALMTAMEAGQKLKQLVKDDEKLGNYPTTRPLLALQTITSNIREKNEFQNDVMGEVLFAPDGKHIVSSTSVSVINGKVIIWNLAGEKVNEWEMPKGKKIDDLAISPNGKYIATAASKSGILTELRLYIWDFSGKKIAEVNPELYSNVKVKFSPDSQYIAAISNGNNKVVFCNLSGQKIKELEIEQPTKYNLEVMAESLEFTPNGEEILIGDSSGVVHFWNLNTWEKIREFKANTNQVTEIAISPDGDKILTLGADVNSNKIAGLAAKLWDLSGKKIADIDFFRNVINGGDVSFSPNGKEIAIVIPNYGIFKFYDFRGGKLIPRTTTNRIFGFNFSYSPDHQIIAFNGFSGIKLLNSKARPDFIELPTNYELEINQARQKGFIDLQYSADGKKLLIIDKYRNYVDIWNWQEKEKRRIDAGNSIINLSSSTSNFASITPDGKFITIVTREGIQKIDLEGNLVSELKVSVGSLERVLKSWITGKYTGDKYYSSNSDGSIIATYGTLPHKNPLRLWDLSTEQVKQVKYNASNLHKILVSQDNKYIVTFLPEGTSKLWDTSGNLLNPLDVNAKYSSNQTEISMIAIVLDFTVEKDLLGRSQIKILDVFQNSTAMKAGLKSGDIIHEIDGQEIPNNTDDIYKLLAGEPGTPVKIKVWSFERPSKREEKTILREKFVFDTSNLLLFMGDTGKFSPDNQYLATWFLYGKRLSLTNIKTKKVVRIETPIWKAYFSPDSKLLATKSEDYSVKIWDFSGKLINQIKLLQIPENIAFSPDSQQIAVLDRNELTIWTIDGQQIAKHTIPEENQTQIVFSPDGKYIATGQNKVFIWHNKNLNELLATGCDWLKEYLATRPEEKAKLKVCQDNPDIQ